MFEKNSWMAVHVDNIVEKNNDIDLDLDDLNKYAMYEP